ncbi:MAG TPA: dTDP-4-dehydrorhamnose 3,5-epimerase [Candidatus Aquilonibacter sp.]|nr:dTDP-4-dehydrorhamnose 3,5-epimerase [Candidatus Aquilonibacter sp.]
MNVARTAIDGALEITPAVFADDRGYFKEMYAVTRFRDAGIAQPFLQDNVSLSKRLTLRGLHSDPRMAKLVQVLRGSAYDVIVDIRKGSPSYLRWIALTLTEKNHKQLYIPAGCLHGFLALEDDTLLVYKQTAEYDPRQEIGVAWNDPDLRIDWPLRAEPPLLSVKDAANRTLRELGYL